MAKANPQLIQALRKAVVRLQNGAKYEWGHMARCNCGHLIQSLTGMTDLEISHAVNHELDEWTEHAKTYCPQSGRPVDDVFEILEQVGFAREDVIHLENLSDKRILNKLGENVHLRRNSREDLVRYLSAFAELLEEEAGPKKGRSALRHPMPEILVRP